MARQESLTSRETLLDVAADVARRFRASGEYGSEQRALRALRRRQPGFEDADYRGALTSALELFDAAYALGTARARDPQQRGPFSEVDLEKYVAQLERHHPGFAPSTYRWLATWTIYYYVLR